MGFGGIAKSQNALTDFSNQMALEGGQMQQHAAEQEAGMLRDQGDMAIYQSLQEAELAKREIAQAVGQQAEGYASSGVTANMGTPLAVMNETRAIGQIKVDSIIQQGQLEANLFRTKANITEEGGLEALMQAEGQTVINTAQNKIQQQQQKAAMFRGLFGGLISGGLSLLGGH